MSATPVRLALALLFVAAGCRTAAPPPAPPALPEPAPAVGVEAQRLERAEAALTAFLGRCQEGACAVPVGRGVEIDTVVFDGRRVEVRFSRDLGNVPFRPETAEAFTREVAAALAAVEPGAEVRVVTRGSAVQDLVPNRARPAARRDPSRLFAPPITGPPLVRPADPVHTPTQGIAGRHVALWPSHGWVYDDEKEDWRWQRPRLFTSVEDLLSVAFAVQELAPMLERAGAVVLMPRERDTQPLQALVDNDRPASGYLETGVWADAGPGFEPREAYPDGTNPFRLGTARASASGRAQWVPQIPETDDYAVYVSYAAGPDRSEAARYTVRHAGGETDLLVNQTIGGGTWVYLGTFRFEAGTAGGVTLHGGDDGRPVSADAVRFGGGMGSVERGGRTSGRPRWVEASRYYQQFSGAPQYVYDDVNGEPDDDYVDDYRSRGEWVNWLRGAPFGPTGRADDPGLRIPVDLSLAWHSDAGIDRDGTVGTLVIYDVPGMEGSRRFPNGVSRLANRDLADTLQDQIVADVRALYTPDWSRRPLWDRNYSEAARPTVPSALLEPLSHQNYRDMRHALDPRFRSTMARAAYKAIGRFLTLQRGEPFVVQPLPVTHFRATLDGGRVHLAWRPQEDPLEPTAWPTGYVVYSRDGDGGWDGGQRVEDVEVRLPAPSPGVVRSYRVAAVNDGGAGEPSEALAVGLAPGGGAPALVVSGFDRVSMPDPVAGADSLGFADPVGVPDGVGVHTTGRQLVFDPAEEYVDDDAPGWGASAADLEATVIAGNTRDYAAVHGRALLAAGRSFVSASDEAVESGAVSLAPYPVVSLALGLERRTPWPTDGRRPPAFEALPAPMRGVLGHYLDGGGALVLSGAHWAGDAAADPAAAAWVRTRLGVRPGAGAAPGAEALRADGPEGATVEPVLFQTEYGPDLYAVRAPDVVEPATGAARTLWRYAGSGRGAAVVQGRAVSFGVPIEAVPDAERRAALVAGALDALGVR